jgi:hypothetical protein
MSIPADANQRSETRRGWRYYLGLILFVLSLVLPLLALVIVPLLGVSPGISAVLYGLSVAGGPDLILIGAAAFLGKENLSYLFSKLGGWFKNLVKWDQVTLKRYRVGVWLLVISVVTSLALFYLLPESLRDGKQPGWGFYVTVGADILFIISFFVLGAEFWAKIQALFQYNARVVVEESSGGS